MTTHPTSHKVTSTAMKGFVQIVTVTNDFSAGPPNLSNSKTNLVYQMNTQLFCVIS